MNRFCSTWGTTLGDDGGGGDIPTPPTGCTGEYWISIYTADDERIWFRKVDGTSQKFTVRDLGANVLRRFDNANYWLDCIYRNGQVVATVNPSGAVANYHLDHLGTPRYITNPSQAKISEHEYFPYGQEATLPQIAEPTRFTGHERDMLTTWQNPADDLDFMHARHQSPTLARFLSVDPVLQLDRAPQRPQLWNRYAYGTGNPLKFIGPTGETLNIVIDYSEASGLTMKQRMAIARGLRQRYLNAGVKDVRIHYKGGLLKGNDKGGPDATVHLAFTDRSLNVDDDQVHGVTPGNWASGLGNRSYVSTFNAPKSEGAMLNYLINIAAHEVGHGSQALEEYDFDDYSFGKGGTRGTLMEQGPSADRWGERVREFSPVDAQKLQYHLNQRED